MSFYDSLKSISIGKSPIKLKSMLRFLQISDIHFHYINDDEDEYLQVRAKLLDDLEYIRENFSPIRALLICGDIAFSGKKEEYDKARLFIKEIVAKLTVNDECPVVYVVPGNHDKNRSVYEETRYALNTVLLGETKAANKFMNSLRMKEIETIKILYAPFREYNSFALENCSLDDTSELLINNEPIAGKQMYYKSTIGNIGGYNVSLIGINSALCCDKYDGNGENGTHLQFLPLSAYNLTRQKHDIFVSMMHHPIKGFILNDASIENRFDDQFQVQLYGHVHKQQSSEKNKSIKIYSGAFQPEDIDDNDYAPVYNIIKLDVKESNLYVDIKSRKWDGNDFVNFEEESKSYVINLSPRNTWTQQEHNKAEESKIDAKTMDNKYRIQKQFMDCPIGTRKSIMNELGCHYDDSKNDISNCIVFIKWVDKNNRWKDLGTKISV